MTTALHDVRSFGLYGESQHLPDVMHCETIAERSVLHDWELASHRHDRLHQLLLMQSGSGIARLDDQEATLAPRTLVNVPAGVVHAFTFEPEVTHGYVITLADEMLDELLGREAEVRLRLSRPWCAEAAPAAEELMARINDEYAAPSPARALILRGLGAALLGHAARSARLDAKHGHLSESHLLVRFEALLEQHYRDHWRVADYASELAVTPTHLSRVVGAVTGKSTSRAIDSRVVREARRQLAFTNLGVSTIAYLLGFEDPALFSRVFARVAGCSPREFRRRLLDARQGAR